MGDTPQMTGGRFNRLWDKTEIKNIQESYSKQQIEDEEKIFDEFHSSLHLCRLYKRIKLFEIAKKTRVSTR